MNARFAVVLLVLLAVLGGGALLVRQQSGAQKKPPEAEALGQPLLKGLKGAEVASVKLREPKATLTLQRKGEVWTIAERGNFPADYDKVRDFVLKALALKIGQSEPASEADRARLELDAGGTAVEFGAADGKALAQFTAGKKYFKAQPENPERAAGDGRFIALPSEPKRVFIVSDPLAQATAKSAEWISKAGFAAEKVKTMELRYPDGSGWKIERSGDNADWKLGGLGAGEKIEVTKANAASYSLSLIELADVAPKDATPAQTGLDKPTVITAVTFDALTYTLKVGRPEGEAYYATLAISGEPKPEGKDAEERLKKINERLPREKALAAHTLLIPKSKLEDVLKKRADLLEKKDAKK
jgi:hypothetical protein